MKELYGQEYYRCDCGDIPYENTEVWAAQFEYLAERIVAVYAPHTVLDAGCAMGYLVAALRDRGVEAYGVDISEYAISKVREDVRPYCAVGSLTEPLPASLPRRYDLVVTIEVLEHLMEEDGKRAIANLCSLADTVLFSSSPEDFAERTHFNVQQREYWAALFAGQGFYDNLLCRPLWLTKHAITFVKKETQTLPQLVWEYERNILRLQKEASERRFEGKLYYNFGQGESEEHCSPFTAVSGEVFSRRFPLPAGCVSVRFDPCEGCGCMVQNLHIHTACAAPEVSDHNGLRAGAVYAFRSVDPQLYISLSGEDNRWIEISAEILPMENAAWTEICQTVERERTAHSEALIRLGTEHEEKMAALLQQHESEKAALSRRCEEEKTALQQQYESEKTALSRRCEEEKAALLLQYESEKAALSQRCEEIGNERTLLREENREQETALDAMHQSLADTQAEVGRLRNEIQDYSNLVAYEREQHRQECEQQRQALDALNHTLNSVLSSRAWRMTKPLRRIMDLMKKILRRLRPAGGTADAAPALIPPASPALPPERCLPAVPITGHPIDPVAVIRVRDKVRRLNLITDSLDGNSLLGGTATALILATEFANRFDYELRIITRQADCNALAYKNMMHISGVEPARKLRFYSDAERDLRALPFKMELSEGELFLATSWWSARAIREMIPGERFFYIIQEVETFFYHYGGERLLCEQMMKAAEINYIVNSHYLFDYFREEAPHIVQNGIGFEPAFPRQLYAPGRFEKKEKFKIFFYSRPNNPRNLFTVGVSLLDRAIETGVLDTEKWSICFVGQDVPEITFCNGSAPVRMGQLSWTEYAAFLADVDLGLCLMYTPHPSYPPYDVACSGGVVLTNRFANKQSFELCDNVIMTELEEEDFLHNLQRAMALAENMEQRRANYEASRIGRDWQSALEEAVDYMGRCSGDV